MSSDSSSLSLDEVNTWNVKALRLFCHKRNLKVSGNKAELVAWVFAASEMGIPVQPSANELIRRTETEEAKLLIAPDKNQMPDPLSLKDNWLRESDGLRLWPPIFLSDITIDLHQGVLNEYKEGKAFRLFASGFLKEVGYNGVSVDSDYCFMKARCTHSMSINDVPHTTWVCAAKKSGEIASAYCTCVAGLVPLLWCFVFKLCLLSFTRLKLSLNKCCSMRFRVFDVVYYTSSSDFGHCLIQI